MNGNASKINSVLIVDDDDNIRLITVMSLEGLTSWKIREARNGKEALSCLEDELPDLILLDVMMPDMSGMDLLGRARTLLGDNLPLIIFMTAKVQTSEIEKYRLLGAAGVIMKPFDPMKLPGQIEQTIAHFSQP